MKKQLFFLEKGVLFVHIGIFIDFLVLEKKCSFDNCRSSIFKNDPEKQPQKLDFPVHQIKKCKKRQNSFRVCSFYIHGKAQIEKCASKKRKVEA